MLLLLDASQDSEALLDSSVAIFNNSERRVNGAYVDGLSQKRLLQVFEKELSANHQYSYAEIIEKVLHTEMNNSEEFIERFIGKCEEQHLKVKLYLNGGLGMQEVITDSFYSDLFVLGKNIFQRSRENRQGLEELEAILKKSKCPLLIVPPKLDAFKNIILLFDGSEKSFECIKLFSYLMGEQMGRSKVSLLNVINDKAVEEEKRICEYLKTYQPHFSIYRFYPDNYYNSLLDILKPEDDFLLVSGISRLDIIGDIVFGREHSFFLQGERSVFML